MIAILMELCPRESGSHILPTLLMTSDDSENPLRNTACVICPMKAAVAISGKNTDHG
jgi:hypothetical protein